MGICTLIMVAMHMSYWMFLEKVGLLDGSSIRKCLIDIKI